MSEKRRKNNISLEKSIKCNSDLVAGIDMEYKELIFNANCNEVTMKELNNRVKRFFREIETPASECYAQIYENGEAFYGTAKKLGDRIRQMLVFFNSFYSVIPEPKNSSFYLSTISDLLARCIDFEIVTVAAIQESKVLNQNSERRKIDDDTWDTFVSKTIISFFHFLDNSESFILDTVLKLKQSVKNSKKYDSFYSAIYRAIFEKASQSPVTVDLSYLKYKLLHQLWKKIATENDSNSIEVAAQWLQPPKGFSNRRKEFFDNSSASTNDDEKEDFYDSKSLISIIESFTDVNEQIRAVLHASSIEHNDCEAVSRLGSNILILTGQIPDCKPKIPLHPPIEDDQPKRLLDDLWNRLQNEGPSLSYSIFDHVPCRSQLSTERDSLHHALLLSEMKSLNDTGVHVNLARRSSNLSHLNNRHNNKRKFNALDSSSPMVSRKKVIAKSRDLKRTDRSNTGNTDKRKPVSGAAKNFPVEPICPTLRVPNCDPFPLRNSQLERPSDKRVTNVGVSVCEADFDNSPKLNRSVNVETQTSPDGKYHNGGYSSASHCSKRFLKPSSIISGIEDLRSNDDLRTFNHIIPEDELEQSIFNEQPWLAH